MPRICLHHGAYIGHVDEALQLFSAPLLTEYQSGLKYPSGSKDGQLPLQGPKRSDRAKIEPTLRLVCLRLALIAMTTTLYFYARDKDTGPVIVISLTFVHHLASAFGKLTLLLTCVDLLLISGEVGYFLCLVIDWFYYSKRSLGQCLSLFILTILLGCLYLLKALHAMDARGSTLFRRVNILASSGDTTAFGTPGDATTAPSKYFFRVIVGSRVWRRILPGEDRWVAVLRGLLALAAVLALLTFGVVVILLGPLTEIDLTPTREYRTVAYQSTDQGDPRWSNFSLPLTSKQIVWNLIVEWKPRAKAPEYISTMVTLKARVAGLREFPCRIIDERGIQIIAFQCFQSALLESDAYRKFPFDGESAEYSFPELHLRVNFTGLTGERDPPPGSGLALARESLKVYVGLTNSTRDVLETTRPTLLFPGMNLIGVVDLVIRKRFRAPQLSVFGLFDVYDTFAIAEMSTVSMAGTAFPQENNPSISTLRITYQGSPGEWRVVQDYREKSIINGLSAVGGLGSFLSLLCALFFGTSLFSVLFRTKPFSAFGILHSRENQRKELARVCRSKFPKLESELRALETEENRGVVALLLDTLLDLDLIKGQFTTAHPSTSDRDTESVRDSDNGEEPDMLLNMGEGEVLPNAERVPEQEQDSV